MTENLPPNFKQTELGPLPEEWDVVRLIEVANRNSEIVGGPFGSNLKVSDYRNSGIPIIRLQNIERNHFIHKEMKFVSKEKAEELKYHSFKKGDIVLAKLGDPIGKTCIVPESLSYGIVTADVVRIRTISNLTYKSYIVHALNSSFIEEQFRREKTGTTRPRVNVSNVRNIKIPLPPLPEQRRIAAVLSSIQEARERTEAVIRAAKELKKSMMKHLFTYGPVAPNEAARVPLKDTEIGPVPESWVVVKFREACDFIRGPFGGSLKKDIFINDGYAVYEQQHAINNQFNNIRYFIDQTKYLEMKRFTVRPGNLIMSCSGTMGKVALVPDGIKEGIINQALLLLIPKDNLFNIYMKHFMDSSKFQEIIRVNSHGVAIKNVASVRVLKDINIPLPPLPVQHRIAVILSSIDNKIQTEENKKKALDEMFKTMLNDLMTAKVRVNEVGLGVGA